MDDKTDNSMARVTLGWPAGLGRYSDVQHRITNNTANIIPNCAMLDTLMGSAEYQIWWQQKQDEEEET